MSQFALVLNNTNEATNADPRKTAHPISQAAAAVLGLLSHGRAPRGGAGLGGPLP